MRSLSLFGALALVAGAIFSSVQSTSAAATPRSIVFNGNTYYVVDGNNAALDSGNEVCAAVGKKFNSYKSVNTTGVCKALHPTAKEITSVNGSKAGFYCNGLPQKGLACEKMKNTCQVCPTCNLNEAADGNQTIGGHFAEMYVWCDPIVSSKAAVTTGGTKSAGPASIPGGNKLSSSSKSSVKASSKSSLKSSSSVKQSSRSSVRVSSKASSSKKTSSSSKSSSKSSARVSSSVSAKKAAGQLCQHGGDCQSGWCLGAVPGRLYYCSCIDPVTQWQGCKK